ncbi:MAG: DNA translocase FtsK 4TM domain-containing protein [Methyloceanibacter sp.]|uniref:FtsK/SpoIIIE family DNA translocase n=1 Tax=Methyloceanibacter sp. TaxID=1965321 RepID=UPI003D6C71C0
MAPRGRTKGRRRLLPDAIESGLRRLVFGTYGFVLIAGACAVWASLATWSVTDPSLNNATRAAPRNLLGGWGAVIADLGIQSLGLASIVLFLPLAAWGWHLMARTVPNRRKFRLLAWPASVILLAAALSALPQPKSWPLPNGLGGIFGDFFMAGAHIIGPFLPEAAVSFVAGLAFLMLGIALLLFACGTSTSQLIALWAPRSSVAGEWANAWLGAAMHFVMHTAGAVRRMFRRKPRAEDDDEGYEDESDVEEWAEERPAIDADGRIEPSFGPAPFVDDDEDFDEDDVTAPDYRITRLDPKQGRKRHTSLRAQHADTPYDPPSLKLLQQPPRAARGRGISDEVLQENARELEGVLQDFGVKGEITNVRPGPVVTLYELEPAPGTKSSRVIGLADDIARSMSAIAARVAVVPGRNAIGIELPNDRREIVMLRQLFESEDFQDTDARLALALGKTIGGEPIIADLSRMPHLLIAGTTGSGKSVGINTMILSLLYRLSPEQCKFIMIDPKMLELSVYDGIPHLLAPVVTDPKKAVVALKWTVREMEERYKRMSKLGVRDIKGYNARVLHAEAKGEMLTRTVQTGFDRATGRAIYEQEEMDYDPMPYIVVIVDEMADLMMVAGKDIEAAVQRLAQMARAAGIHLITATQRPSVDVITGTIKANFPTRVSFQVTSKIDSRTILGEQGAEQLLGQGDMLYMAGGGRIIRVHGPFVADEEVEKVVRHLKKQGVPSYLDAVTDEEENDEDGDGGSEYGESGDDLYDQAVAIVLRDRKASTSYVQRRLGIGYNRAATLVERMENEGLIGPANHAGKREILVGGDEAAAPY